MPKGHVVLLQRIFVDSTHVTSQGWAKKMVVTLQEYTFNMWKKRNTFLHGENKETHRKKQHDMCVQRTKELYNMDRHILTQEDREVFKLPLRQRVKQGIMGLSLWIDMVESLFDNALKKEGKKLENPMFRRKKIVTVYRVKRRKPKTIRIRQRKKKQKHISQYL